MVDEFGVDKDGDIEIRTQCLPVWFFRKNKAMCGQTFTVKSLDRSADNWYYRSEEGLENYSDGYYKITCEMLEPLDDSDWDIATDDDIAMLLK